jgi:hypothetical protein
MPRRHNPRAIKFCAYCGAGYDGFKAMELRGRYCSPVCLAAARAAHRAAPQLGIVGEGSPVLTQ